jgi:hypothetical protein
MWSNADLEETNQETNRSPEERWKLKMVSVNEVKKKQERVKDAKVSSTEMKKSRVCWTPVAHTCIATQEAEIRRIVIRSQPRQIVRKISSQKNHHKKGLVEWLKV